MSRKLSRFALVESTRPGPVYELRIRQRSSSNREFEVWQLPAPATPNLESPRRIAGLHGRNLAFVEMRLLRTLARAGVRLGQLPRGEVARFPLTEELALQLGLVSRVLAPMRLRGYMRACVEGIEAMGKEEAAYWLGMAMHRKNPRRVLTALRVLLTDPKRK